MVPSLSSILSSLGPFNSLPSPRDSFPLFLSLKSVIKTSPSLSFSKYLCVYTYILLYYVLHIRVLVSSLLYWPNMSVQVVPPISQLLYSNGRYSSSKSATSVFGTTRDFLFVDFIGLCSKSKRRIRASSGGPSISRFHSKNLSAIKAVIDLERTGNASTQSSDSKRKV